MARITIVVNGEDGVEIDKSRAAWTDVVKAAGGLIHLIDKEAPLPKSYVDRMLKRDTGRSGLITRG